MKYEDLSKIAIEYTTPDLPSNAVSEEQLEEGKLAIDSVHLVSVESLSVGFNKSVTARVSGKYQILLDGKAHEIRVYFAITRTPFDDINGLTLDVDDIDKIKTNSFSLDGELGGSPDEAGEYLIVNRHKEILHLLTLCEDWTVLYTWIKSELRYRLSY